MSEFDFLSGRIASRHMPRALASSRDKQPGDESNITCNTTTSTGPGCLDVTIGDDCEDKRQKPGEKKQPGKKKQDKPPSKKQ